MQPLPCEQGQQPVVAVGRLGVIGDDVRLDGEAVEQGFGVERVFDV